MAIYRNIQMKFWTDTKVVDDYTPEERYFYLYLMTNPHTNLCGCYEVSMKQMATETGYNQDTVEKLIRRMEECHKSILYCRDRKEVLIVNWSKYNWILSDKFRKPLLKEIEAVKTATFQRFLLATYNGEDASDLLSEFGIVLHADETMKKTDPYLTFYDDIIGYLNAKTGARYRSSAVITRKHIRARLEEGYVPEDFYLVIDKKADEWTGTQFEKFLVPETLFGSKFEKYLNQNIVSDASSAKAIDWSMV